MSWMISNGYGNLCSTRQNCGIHKDSFPTGNICSATIERIGKACFSVEFAWRNSIVKIAFFFDVFITMFLHILLTGDFFNMRQFDHSFQLNDKLDILVVWHVGNDAVRKLGKGLISSKFMALLHKNVTGFRRHPAPAVSKNIILTTNFRLIGGLQHNVEPCWLLDNRMIVSCLALDPE